MVATYGSTNGFGWKLHEVVGAELVSVPMSLPLEQAHQTFMTFMAILLGVFVLIIIVLNVLLHYERTGRDEISLLASSFNRMCRSLDSAMRMLEP